MDEVCSSQLLTSVRRMVLTLTQQNDESKEFVKFFHKQLGSILQVRVYTCMIYQYVLCGKVFLGGGGAVRPFLALYNLFRWTSNLASIWDDVLILFRLSLG